MLAAKLAVVELVAELGIVAVVDILVVVTAADKHFEDSHMK